MGCSQFSLFSSDAQTETDIRTTEKGVSASNSVVFVTV